MESTGLQIVVIFLLALCARSLSSDNQTDDAHKMLTAMYDSTSSSMAVPSSTTHLLLVSSSSSSSSSAPTTTTTSSNSSTTTTTTTPPTTPVLPAKSRWNVTSPEGNVCILLESGIRLTFNYKNSTNQNVTGATTDVPSDAVSSGSCGGSTQSISLQFYNNWTLTMQFSRNSTTSGYYMSSVSLSYSLRPNHLPFPHIKEAYDGSIVRPLDGDSFEAPVGTSYICTSQQTVFEDQTVSVGLTGINLYDSHVEAFRANTTSPEFSTAGARCTDDELSLLVPIIVGACLAGLIVIVLLAYFIGRHHSKRGYQNV